MQIKQKMKLSDYSRGFLVGIASSWIALNIIAVSLGTRLTPIQCVLLFIVTLAGLFIARGGTEI